jgi:hypothetical protein
MPRRAVSCSCAGMAWPEALPAPVKSGSLNVLMGNLTACPDVVIWAIDLKKGIELKPGNRALDGSPRPPN